MLEKNQLSEVLQPLDEALLLQEFQVEELEKRYEFSWFDYSIENGRTGEIRYYS
jgi:hypothetical protein